ncbi:DUF3347 domain-containing protein [Aquimarina mytili]
MLMTVSCNKDKKTTTGGKNENSNTIENTQSKVEFIDKSTQEIYGTYLKIKNGLVNSNSKVVQEESKKIEAALDDSKDKEQLKATLKLISLTKNIEEQRGFFVTLTAEVEKLINATEIKSGEIYKQFCPMAFDGEGGYWLSDSKGIRNPYFGDKMLKCGSVKSVLK